MYTYRQAKNSWLVINSETNRIQSAWTHKADAMTTVKDLNKLLVPSELPQVAKDFQDFMEGVK